MKNKILHLQKNIGFGLLLCAALSGANLQAQPVITNQPASIATNIGATVVFHAGASGALGYRWYFSGTNFPVAIAGPGNISGLTLRNVQSSQAGDYYVVVTNAVASVTSSIATLSFPDTPPSISHQPAGLSVKAGANASFSVTASGSSPLSYHWLFNGGYLPIPGGPLYSLYHVSTNQAGDYSVIITNSFGAVTSSLATLTVNVISATNSPAISIVSHSPVFGDVLKLFTLDVGSSYRVQSSLNISGPTNSWTDFMTVFAYASTLYCTNNAATNNQTFYYRLVSP